MDVCTYNSVGDWRVCPPLMKTLRKRIETQFYKTKLNSICHLEAMYIKVTIT
jgi:hypothetical protein